MDWISTSLLSHSYVITVLLAERIIQYLWIVIVIETLTFSSHIAYLEAHQGRRDYPLRESFAINRSYIALTLYLSLQSTHSVTVAHDLAPSPTGPPTYDVRRMPCAGLTFSYAHHPVSVTEVCVAFC